MSRSPVRARAMDKRRGKENGSPRARSRCSDADAAVALYARIPLWQGAIKDIGKKNIQTLTLAHAIIG